MADADADAEADADEATFAKIYDSKLYVKGSSINA